ncbi:MAG: 50S ribosomal protein L30 [Bacteroidia bacterium]
MSKIKITQIVSGIGHPERQKLTIRALGIRKLNHSVEKENTPQIQGMIRQVSHLVKIENV